MTENITAAELRLRREMRQLKERKERQTDIIPFEQNGHLVSSWPSTAYIRDDIEHLRRMIETIPGMPLGGLLHISRRCTFCGDQPGMTLGDDDVIRIDTPCPSANGITTVIDLHVPSGKIIVADSLHPIYDADMGDLDYNSAIGQGKFVERMAAIGCAYGPVGNSSPRLYKTGDGTYVIANPAWNDETDEPIDDLGEALASVCTDLWAYSIADYDDWVSKGGEVTSWTQTVVDVEPGTYRFTHHTGERTFKDEVFKPTIYADISWRPFTVEKT